MSLLIDCHALRRLRKRLERQVQPSASGTPAPLPLEAVPSTELDTEALSSGLANDGEGEEVVQSLPDVRELDENFETAFQLAMIRGPLCAEPVIGMAYFLEEVALNDADLTISQGSSAHFPELSWD